MAEVKSEGATRLQSNDGKVNIGISSNKTDMVIPIDGEDRLKISNQEVKLSQEGLDVNTASDQDSIINNTNNVFKIVDETTLTLPAVTVSNGGTAGWNNALTTATYVHNLGFKPSIIAFREYPSGGRIFMPDTNTFFYSFQRIVIESNAIDTTATTLTVSHTALMSTLAGGAQSETLPAYTVKVYLLQEPSE